MIKWYAKFDGRTKRLEDIASPELRAMVEPLQAFLADRLGSLANDTFAGHIDVVFSWGSDGVLSFTIAGDQLDIAEAISLVGQRAEFRSLDS